MAPVSEKEKKDVDDMDAEKQDADMNTRELFLEQGSWGERRKREMQEFLDAKNQEVKKAREI